ncbi:acyltransferase family protein [Citrobacter freundii]|uniref:acyltransferase family protein n=1 Tax=Citrobacter freundii TaxID=546 RepID=UPI003A83C50F
MEHLKYRPDIDGMRAIAVLSVVIFHYFPNAIPGGFVGVDIFFVISGYLITSIILKSSSTSNFSFVDFYKRRALRIFPSLLIVLIFSIVIGWVYLFQSDYKSLGKHIFSGSFFISNFILWSESGYFDSQSYLKPLLHLWSLGIEEQFYLIWPVIIILCFKFKNTHKIILISCVLIYFLSYLCSIATMDTPGGANYYSPASRFWELMAGAIIASIKFVGVNTNIFRYMSLYGTLLLMLSMYIIDNKLPFPGYIALMPVLGATLIIASDGNSDLSSKVLSSKPFVFIGKISYPFYLWHWPIYSFYKTVFSSTPNNKTLCVLVAISFVLSILTYFFIEKPIRFSKRKSSIISLYASILIVGVIGAMIYIEGGVKNRDINRIAGEYASVTDVYDFYKFQELLRAGVCHSVSIEKAISNSCIKNQNKNIFIIGDSYAAALYSGLSNYLSEHRSNYVISQMTDGNAPPLFVKGKSDQGRNIISINNSRISEIKRVKPDIVLLTWFIRGQNAIYSEQGSITSLEFTVNKIREASPKSKIIVIGPVPEWNENLMKALADYYKNKLSPPPAYMSYKLSKDVKLWDDYFSTEIPKMGVEYISAFKALCNENGCLTRVSDGLDNLTAVDWGHLTKPGSEFLFNKIGNKIVK